MKLTVLGCWAPYPAPGGACSGYLLQAGGKNILLDCGNGVVSNLQKHIDFRQLDLVLISHLHPDHHHDLYCLRHAIGGARRTDKTVNPVPVYLPDNPHQDFDKIRHFNDAFVVQSVESLPASTVHGVDVRKVNFNGLEISFVPVSHSLTSYGIMIKGEGKLFYSGDTKWMDYLSTFAAGVDLMICEASIIEADKDYRSIGHLTASEAGELGKKAGVKELVITHFWPQYEQETLKKEAEKAFGAPVIMASEGLQLDL